MVVRLTPARRATSSSATRPKPCCSNSTTVASRTAVVAGSAGVTDTGKTVVAQPHWQVIPQPVDRTRPPRRGETLIAALLAVGPRQAEQGARPRRQATGRQKRRDRIERRRHHAPHQRRHTLGAGESLSHISDT